MKWDQRYMALAKEGLNKIGEYPQFNKNLLEPISKNLKGIEQSIIQMEKFSPWKEDAGWKDRNVKARADYEKIRDDLKRSLDNLELVAEQQKNKSEQAMASKWDDLRSSEDSSKMIQIITGLIYFIFVWNFFKNIHCKIILISGLNSNLYIKIN